MPILLVLLLHSCGLDFDFTNSSINLIEGGAIVTFEFSKETTIAEAFGRLKFVSITEKSGRKSVLDSIGDKEDLEFMITKNSKRISFFVKVLPEIEGANNLSVEMVFPPYVLIMEYSRSPNSNHKTWSLVNSERASYM